MTRHSVTSYASAAGASPKLVAEHLGHFNVSTTLDIYACVFESASRETADGIARVLAREPTTRDVKVEPDRPAPLPALE